MMAVTLLRGKAQGEKNSIHTQCTQRNYGNYEFTHTTQWHHYWTGHHRQRRQRMPLARYRNVADTRKIIEIKLDLHHKLHNK